MTGIRLASAFAFCASVATGQNAELSGLIQDPSNSGVSGAEVTIRNEHTGGRRSTSSNASGFYSLPALSPGLYRLSIRASGFETIVREGIKLEVAEKPRMDFSLRLGDVRTEVTVHSDRPLINSEDASVGTVIDRNLIDQMPLNGRGIQALIELAPGVNVIPVTDVSRGQFSINGQRTGANYFTIDGISANFATGNSMTVNAPQRGTIPTVGQAGGGMLPATSLLGTFTNLLAPDALQEFKIQTSSYAPEFGHLPGGQIDLVSRSGSNRYSGSLFEYVRNAKFDANDWFNNATAISKPPLRFNNFGGTLGGPVRIGNWFDGRNGTFFFFSVDELFASQPSPSVTLSVPTLAARQNAPAPLASFLSLFPLPNGGLASAPGFGFYKGAASRQYRQGVYGLRLDHSVPKNINFFIRMNHAPSTRSEPFDPIRSLLTSLPLLVGSPSNLEHYRVETDSLTLGVTQVFTPSLVNEFRFGASRQSTMDYADLDTGAGARNPGDGQIFPPGFSAADSLMLIGLGYGSPNPPGVIDLGLVQKNQSSQLEAADQLFYSRGAHRWKFGGNYRAFRTAVVQPRFEGAVPLPAIYDPDGSFISAINASLAYVYAPPKTAYLVPSFSAYAQDTWRISQALTMTCGVRWEVAPAPRTTAGIALVAGGLTDDLNDASNVFLIPQGKPFYPTTYANFAPRLGLAWRIFGGSSKSIVLRVGAGRFFSSGQAGFQDSAIGPTVSLYDHPPLQSLFSGTPSQSGAQQVLAVAAAPHYRLPVTDQWNVTIEQALGPQTLSVGYVGALGRRLIDFAQGLPLTDSAGGKIQRIGNDGRSSYHSMQIQFNRRLPGRLQVLTSYTWSHSIDNLSNDVGYAQRGIAPYLNPNGDRGSSDFDIRHSLRGAVIAQLPSPRHGAWAAALGHWSAQSIFFAQSALPTDIVWFFSPNYRPDYVYGAPLYLYGSQYPGGKAYNPKAFAPPPKDVNGNLGRNVVRGFPAWQIDLALHREIRLSEGTRLQFRVEAFNLLNHPNFANPGESGAPSLTYLDGFSKFGVSRRMLASGLGPSSNLGELNPLFQMGSPRVLQFALRFLF